MQKKRHQIIVTLMRNKELSARYISCLALILCTIFITIIIIYFFNENWRITRDTYLMNEGSYLLFRTISLYWYDIFLYTIEYFLIVFVIFFIFNTIFYMKRRENLYAAALGLSFSVLQILNSKTYFMFDNPAFLERSGINDGGINAALFYKYCMSILIFSTIFFLFLMKIIAVIKGILVSGGKNE